MLPKINAAFKPALTASAQDRQIIELQSVITNLRNSQSVETLEQEIETLREQLTDISGEQQISVDLIDANPEQPRKTLGQQLVQAKARLLEKHGQISPILLIARPDKRYILLDGYLRAEAAKLLGWQTIRALVIAEPEDMNTCSLMTFLGSEDLNPLDKAEAIAVYLSKETGIPLDRINSAIAASLKKLERKGLKKLLVSLVELGTEEQAAGLSKVDLQPDQRQIILKLLELGLNPASVRTNLFPMLGLPPDLKDAIRFKNLTGSHASALATLSSRILSVPEQVATLERENATQIVLEQKLNVPETRRLINQIRQKFKKCSDNKNPPEFQKMLNFLDDINDPETLKNIESIMLEKIETLINRLVSEE